MTCAGGSYCKSQITIARSFWRPQIAAALSPSGLAASAWTAPKPKSSAVTSPHAAVSVTRTTPREPPVIIAAPSGANATAFTPLRADTGDFLPTGGAGNQHAAGRIDDRHLVPAGAPREKRRIVGVYAQFDRGPARDRVKNVVMLRKNPRPARFGRD